jgi:hypothetical protein
MGGRAFYVWGSFGACLLLMVAEPILRSAAPVRCATRCAASAWPTNWNRKPG